MDLNETRALLQTRVVAGELDLLSATQRASQRHGGKVAISDLRNILEDHNVSFCYSLE